MKQIFSEISYLKGLVEGFSIDSSSKEGKFMIQTIKILDLLANDIDELNESQFDILNDLDSISSNLQSIDTTNSDYNNENQTSISIDYPCPNCNHSIQLNEIDLFSDNDVICTNCKNNLFSDELINEDLFNNIESDSPILSISED